jgi:coproporphyrinogen III oxidase
VLENGLVFEKAAVNTTVSRLVKAPAERLKNLAHDHPQYAKMLARGAPVDLYTASVSLILHPWNPHAPTVHANYRYCACGLSNCFFCTTGWLFAFHAVLST